MTEAPPAVALLIDADNAALGSLDRVLETLAEYGEVKVRRAYGNWFKSALKAWDPALSPDPPMVIPGVARFGLGVSFSVQDAA